MKIKIILLSFLILVALAQRCSDDAGSNSDLTEDYKQPDACKQIKVQKEAAKQWNQFYSESHRRLNEAEKEIACATDRVYEHDTKNKLELEFEIVKAEGILEQLCEKLERGSRFNDAEFDNKTIARMKDFIHDY